MSETSTLCLLAHGGLEETTPVTHCSVVHDEIGFTPDVLQRLSNPVGDMFAKSGILVSVPDYDGLRQGDAVQVVWQGSDS